MATRALKELGAPAVPALRRALGGRPSPEVGRRARRLRDALRASPSAGASVWMLRAIEALERAGTPEAKAVLRALADGAPEARQTQEAGAALARLASLGK